jgi:transcription elongation factor GreA
MYDELTKKDIEKMKEEIEYRKLVVRKEALEAVKEARSHGDLSENFEYHAAKKDKNQNESRIRYLERMIKTAKVVSEESEEDEVGLNNTVEVYFEEDDLTEEFTIVTTIRGNSLKGLISRESPLGKAIFGHKAGERVEVKVDEDYSYFVQIKALENRWTTMPSVSGSSRGGQVQSSSFKKQARFTAPLPYLSRMESRAEFSLDSRSYWSL